MIDLGNMPERLWIADNRHNEPWWLSTLGDGVFLESEDDGSEDTTAYVRADLLTAAEARIAQLDELRAAQLKSADALTELAKRQRARIVELERALGETARVAGLLAHDLNGRIDGVKVDALVQVSGTASAALRNEGDDT